MKFAWFALAITTGFLAALCSYPALALERRQRAVALAGLAVPIALSPLWIPAQAAFDRLLAAISVSCRTLASSTDRTVPRLTSWPPGANWTGNNVPRPFYL